MDKKQITVDREYLIRCMRELIQTPSPVGCYEEITPLIEAYAAELGYQISCDRKHTIYITVDGQDNTKTVMVGAHLDTLGLMAVSYTHLDVYKRQLHRADYHQLHDRDSDCYFL